MLAALAAATLLCAASAVVGEAVARLLGVERWRGWSPAVGLAVVTVVVLLALELPGHGTTAAIAFAALAIGAAWIALRGDAIPIPPWHVIALTLLIAIAVCVPYLSNGRFGIIGFSFNNDLSMHLPWSFGLRDPDMPARLLPTAGYPLGAHSITATLSSLLDIEVKQAMAGLLMSIPVLIGWAALPLMNGLSSARKLLAALLVAAAYTVSAFYVQASFKELLLTLFLVAIVAVARDAARKPDTRAFRVGLQIGLLGGGIVMGFSYGGVAWPVLAAGVWATLVIVAAALSTSGGLLARAGYGFSRLWPAIPAAFAAITAGALVIATDISRVIDSWTLFGSSPSGTGVLRVDDAGHLVGPVSKREIFGVWPREDFRFGFDHSQINDLLVLLALVIAVYAFVWWILRRDFALPAAVVATVIIAVYLSDNESPYTASKALAPAGALMMAMSARAILGVPPRIPIPGIRLVSTAVALVFAAGALWSSFLVLRGAQVGPTDHENDLAQLAQTLFDKPTAYLGNDDFAATLLPGVPIVTRPLGRPAKVERFDGAFDFDSFRPDQLDGFDYVIAPRTRYQSEPPASFRQVEASGSFLLWRRVETTPPGRRILSEGSAPGAILDCSTPKGRRLGRQRGWARVWDPPPITKPIPERVRIVPTGGGATTMVDLPKGRWELSLSYVSPQAVRIASGGQVTTMPANLDRAGPYWRIGTITSNGQRPMLLRFDVAGDNLRSKNHFAQLLSVAAAPVDEPPRLMPLDQACGHYVDWYTLGPERPAVPAARPTSE